VLTVAVTTMKRRELRVVEQPGVLITRRGASAPLRSGRSRLAPPASATSTNPRRFAGDWKPENLRHADPLPTAIGVFVSGHTHAPALTNFDRPTGGQGAVVNSGCWLRQLQPIPARIGVPAVFVSRFSQTHVRVYRDSQATHVELWDHPRPATQRLRVAERLAVAGRLPAEPAADVAPRVRARTSIEQTSRL
jgi:hypothetical protein